MADILSSCQIGPLISLGIYVPYTLCSAILYLYLYLYLYLSVEVPTVDSFPYSQDN